MRRRDGNLDWRWSVCVLSVVRSLLLAVGLLGLVTLPGLAQQTTQLPDAPSASGQQSKTQQSKGEQPPPQSDSEAVNLLAGRSRIFPNLAVNTRPLTSNEKLVLAARNSVSGLTIIGSAMGAGLNQARNTQTGYGQGAEGYFKRFGASMAFSATSNMIGTFAIASMLHEDPRYFVKNSPNFGESAKYAASRVFITRMDNGRSGVNWAGLLGPLGSAAVANTYLPADSRGVGDTFSHWGTALAISMGTNLLREYWPRINKKLRLPNMGINDSSVAPAAQQPPPPPTPPVH
jgi:hypothetical protein